MTEGVDPKKLKFTCELLKSVQTCTGNEKLDYTIVEDPKKTIGGSVYLKLDPRYRDIPIRTFHIYFDDEMELILIRRHGGKQNLRNLPTS